MRDVNLSSWLPKNDGFYAVKIRIISENTIKEEIRVAYFERYNDEVWIWRVMEDYESYDVYKNMLTLVYGEFDEYMETIVAWKPLDGDGEWM